MSSPDFIEYVCTACGRDHRFATPGPKVCVDCGAFCQKYDN